MHSCVAWGQQLYLFRPLHLACGSITFTTHLFLSPLFTCSEKHDDRRKHISLSMHLTWLFTASLWERRRRKHGELKLVENSFMSVRWCRYWLHPGSKNRLLSDKPWTRASFLEAEKKPIMKVHTVTNPRIFSAQLCKFNLDFRLMLLVFIYFTGPWYSQVLRGFPPPLLLCCSEFSLLWLLFKIVLFHPTLITVCIVFIYSSKCCSSFFFFFSPITSYQNPNKWTWSLCIDSVDARIDL